jgi:hypothetical protein
MEVGLNPSFAFRLSNNDQIISLMLDAGCHITDIFALAAKVGLPALHYVYTRISPRLKGQHTTCTKYECLSNRLDLSIYSTAHWPAECSYSSFAESPQDQLR